MLTDMATARGKVLMWSNRTWICRSKCLGPCLQATISKELESVKYLTVVADTTNHKYLMIVPVLRRYIAPQKKVQTEVIELNKSKGESVDALRTCIMNALHKYWYRLWDIISVRCGNNSDTLMLLLLLLLLLQVVFLLLLLLLLLLPLLLLLLLLLNLPNPSAALVPEAYSASNRNKYHKHKNNHLSG
jgi:hypothetical protein